MCKLPDAVLNSEVVDLYERIKQYCNPALQYACRSWHKHLIDKDVTTSVVTSILHQFLEKKFLFWLEVLSVLGAAREAVDVLGVAARWLKVCWVSHLIFCHIYWDWIQELPTLDLVNDCFCFVTRFFEVISTSSPHIYHSALPLSPKPQLCRNYINHMPTPLQELYVDFQLHGS